MHHSFRFNAEVESIVSVTVKLSTSDLKVKFDRSGIHALLKVGENKRKIIRW